MADYMTLKEAEQFVENAVLRLPTSKTEPVEIDQSILAACSEFVSRVRPIQNTADVTTTEDDHEITVSEDGFLPRRLVRVNLIEDGVPKPPLEITNETDVEDRLKEENEGKPKRIAFSSETLGILDPIPDDTYTLRFRWWVPFVEFDPGKADAETTELNIPRDMIYGVLWYGVPAYYHRGTEQRQLVQEARAHFEDNMRFWAGQTNRQTNGMVRVNEDAY